MKFVGNVTVYPFLNQNDVGNIMLTPGGNITQNQIDQNRTPNITKLTLLSDPISTLSFFIIIL